jgi:hypothetical protein
MSFLPQLIFHHFAGIGSTNVHLQSTPIIEQIDKKPFQVQIGAIPWAESWYQGKTSRYHYSPYQISWNILVLKLRDGSGGFLRILTIHRKDFNRHTIIYVVNFKTHFPHNFRRKALIKATMISLFSLKCCRLIETHPHDF